MSLLLKRARRRTGGAARSQLRPSLAAAKRPTHADSSPTGRLPDEARFSSSQTREVYELARESPPINKPTKAQRDVYQHIYDQRHFASFARRRPARTLLDFATENSARFHVNRLRTPSRGHARHAKIGPQPRQAPTSGTPKARERLFDVFSLRSFCPTLGL